MKQDESLTVRICHTLANNNCRGKSCPEGFLLSGAAKYCCTIDYNADLHRRRFSLENGIDQVIAQSAIRDENQFNQDATFTGVKFVVVTSANGITLNTEVIMWQSVFASSSVRQQPCIVVQRKEPIRESWWFDPRTSLTNSGRNSLYGIAATLQHRYILFSNILNDYDGCETNFTELRWPSLTFHSWDGVLNKVETERYTHVMLSWFIAGS